MGSQLTAQGQGSPSTAHGMSNRQQSTQGNLGKHVHPCTTLSCLACPQMRTRAAGLLLSRSCGLQHFSRPAQLQAQSLQPGGTH